MYTPSETYVQLANSNGRIIEILVEINGVEYQSEVIEFNIQHELSPDISDIVIGKTPSARINLKLNTTEYIPSKSVIKPYVKFIGEVSSEFYPLGVFFCDYRYVSRGIMSMTGYDKMLYLDSLYESSLDYPASYGEVVDEICDQLGISRDFYTPDLVLKYPIVDYSYRDSLGFLAGLIGGNAVFDNEGKLTFTDYSNVGFIDLKNCTEQQLNREILEITRLVCIKDSDTTLERGDGNDYHTLAFNNPIIDEDGMDYIYDKLSGLICQGLNVTKQGAALFRIGDVIETVDNNNRSQQVKAVVSFLEYEFKNSRFKEIIQSKVRSQSQANYVNKAGLESVIQDQITMLQEGVYSFSNTSTKTISDVETNVISIRFIAEEKCTPIFNGEIEAVVTSAGVIRFIYYVDGIEYSLSPKQSVHEGYHILSLFLYLPIQKSSVVEFRVAIIGENGCAGYISSHQVNATIRGQGLSTKVAEWDGSFKLTDSFKGINFTVNHTGVKLGDNIRDMITPTIVPVIYLNLSDDVGRFSVSMPEVEFKSVFDHLQFEETILAYTLIGGTYYERFVDHDNNSSNYCLNNQFAYESQTVACDYGYIEILEFDDFNEIEVIENIEIY